MSCPGSGCWLLIIIGILVESWDEWNIMYQFLILTHVTTRVQEESSRSMWMMMVQINRWRVSGNGKKNSEKTKISFEFLS